MEMTKEQQVLQWFDQHARPFLEKHETGRVASLQGDYERLMDAMKSPKDVTVCFLGNSGVGKSTLLNALAADDVQLLPAGGIGPLTAQATEIRYSDTPIFRVVYHPKAKLWQAAFALEARLLRQRKAAGAATAESEAVQADLAKELTDEERSIALANAISDEAVQGADTTADSLDLYIKQAKNIVCGDQFAERNLDYLVDALRVACGLPTKWGTQLDPKDHPRVTKVKTILSTGKDDRVYERRMANDRPQFMEDLKAHAAGFLSPLIERIEVGWPADLLKSGVKLVDLPGVGIAQDSYRDVTNEYVKNKARAVIVVVDRAGPTESTVDLLRTSGYWSRLVGAADDPTSDPCYMLIAVTKVDGVADEERQRLMSNLEEGQPKPKKRDVYLQLVQDFKPRMRAQITEQLQKIGDADNEAVQTARNEVRKTILESLEIHPVSAPELRRLIQEDEDDLSFLKLQDETGIPGLRQSLERLARLEQENKAARILEIRERLLKGTVSELELVAASWLEDTRAHEEAVKLQEALDEILEPRKKEYVARAAEFRGYLRETVQARIETLVMEAKEEAEKDVQKYLRRLRNAHWATLRAAVRRGGTYYGSTHISLPDDISDYFQEPMAAVWGQKLLRDIRKRTTELANDIESMVAEICEWAKEEAGASVNKQLLESQQERIAALASQMRAVGKEAVEEMRDVVKNEMTKTIRGPITEACEKFVANGDHVGAGVKDRILALFETLAKDATTAAKAPAIRILKNKSNIVIQEIQNEFKNGGDPLQDTADLIVQRHGERQRRSAAQKRKSVLAEIESVTAAVPDMTS